MRIEGLEKAQHGARVRARANVLWEDCERPPFELYFDTVPEFADALVCSADAFMLAAIVPAMHYGERRVQIDGSVCPQLRNGIVNALFQLRAWYGEARHLVPEIEPRDGFTAPYPDHARHTALFMSGGVDALAALRRNRLELPLDHPGAVRTCAFVHGLDIASIASLDPNETHFEWARARLAEFGAAADFSLLPAYTNAAHLGDDNDLFVTESHGAVIAAVAHSFGARIGTALIASSESVFDSEPWGSSPMLDPHYSNAALGIRHDSTALTRLEKVALIAEWPEALRYLRTCHDPQRGAVLNCGRCEKCLRTMTALVVCGKLDACPALPLDDVPASLLEQLNTVPGDSELPLMFLYHEMFWRELVAPLRARGRADLANVIEAKIDEFARLRARREGRDWRGQLKRADRRLTGGLLGALYRCGKRLRRVRTAA